MGIPTVHLRHNKLKDGTKSYYLDYFIDGDRKYSPIGKVPKNEANRRLTEKIKELSDSHGYFSEPEVLSLSELIERHIQLREKTIVASTLTKYQYYQEKIESFIDQAGRELFVDLKKITPGRFDFLVNKLHNFTEKPQTRASFLSFIKAAENTAIKKGLISRKFSDEAPIPKIPKKMNANYFTKKELVQIWEEMEEFYVPICKFLVNTGLRIGELCNLRWKDVDLERNVITVQTYYDENGKTLYTPKGANSGGGSTRNLPLIKEAKKIIIGRDQSTEYIFTSKTGRKLYRRIVNEKLKDALDKIGITDRSGVHTFRRTFGSLAAQRGIPFYKISKYMGHTQQRVTELYAFLAPNEDKEIFDGLTV